MGYTKWAQDLQKLVDVINYRKWKYIDLTLKAFYPSVHY